MTIHHTPYESWRFWYSFHYLTKLLPMVHPLWWPLILIIMSLSIPAWFTLFPDFWSTYKHRCWYIYHQNRFVCVHTLFSKYHQWQVILNVFTNAKCDSKDIFLMHFTHRFLSNIMLPCSIMISCHTTKPLLLSDSILIMVTATIRLATCVLHGVCWPLIRIVFSSLQSESEWEYSPNNYSLTFKIDNFTVSASTTKPCLDFYRG